MRDYFLRTILVALISGLAEAHPQPTTLVLLDVGSDRVRLSLHLPLNELELAFGHHVTRRPDQTLPAWRSALAQYLLEHIRVEAENGRPWSLQVLDMTVESGEQKPQEVLVRLALTPPLGASVRSFNLRYDVILHQVVTHKALVSIQSDWAGGRVEPAQVGVIAVDTGTTRIEPLAIRLGEGGWWAGFRAMVSLGVRHIREGTDHLLFLIVLLLPATLTLHGRRWGGYGGAQYSLWRVVKIVTAFTIGHSLTLLAGSLRWVALPGQPVEVVIALSILVTAIHAIRPVFAGREAEVAAGFGLVHGLAFATVLADLNLEPGPMALSIFGFNLGIELMQLFVIALTMPWLIVLSMTPAHPWVRQGGAALSAIAALGWAANRVTGQANGVERAMNGVTEFAPLGILLLALITIPAYTYTTLRGRRSTLLKGDLSREEHA